MSRSLADRIRRDRRAAIAINASIATGCIVTALASYKLGHGWVSMVAVLLAIGFGKQLWRFYRRS